MQYIQNANYRHGIEFIEYVIFEAGKNLDTTEKFKQQRVDEAEECREYLENKFFPKEITTPPEIEKTKKLKKVTKISEKEEIKNSKEIPKKSTKLKLKRKISVRDQLEQPPKKKIKFF